MKPNILTYAVISTLGFTGNWDISHGIEQQQRSEMIDFLVGAVQPNLHMAIRKAMPFIVSGTLILMFLAFVIVEGMTKTNDLSKEQLEKQTRIIQGYKKSLEHMGKLLK